jgi:hypothetical protein
LRPAVRFQTPKSFIPKFECTKNFDLKCYKQWKTLVSNVKCAELSCPHNTVTVAKGVPWNDDSDPKWSQLQSHWPHLPAVIVTTVTMNAVNEVVSVLGNTKSNFSHLRRSQGNPNWPIVLLEATAGQQFTGGQQITADQQLKSKCCRYTTFL